MGRAIPAGPAGFRPRVRVGSLRSDARWRSGRPDTQAVDPAPGCCGQALIRQTEPELLKLIEQVRARRCGSSVNLAGK